MNNNNTNVLIQDNEQYDYVKGYVMDYINKLLNKMTIVKKKELREIYNDLDNVGYCTSDRKYNFLIKFLEVDYKHKGTHIEKYVYDLKRYKEEMNRGGTLEKWLVG